MWRVQCGDHLIPIHVVNGVYYLNGKFEEEKQFCRNRLNVNYNPEAPKPEMWLKYLKDLVVAEERQKTFMAKKNFREEINKVNKKTNDI